MRDSALNCCVIHQLAEGTDIHVCLCFIDLFKVNGFFTAVLVDRSGQPHSGPP